MKKIIFTIIFLFSICSYGRAHELDLRSPVLVDDSWNMFQEGLTPSNEIVNSIKDIRVVIKHLHQTFNNEHLDWSRYLSEKLKKSNKTKKEVRKEFLGDAEWVLGFGIKNVIKPIQKDRISLDIYSIVLTEGSLFLIESRVTMVHTAGIDPRWQIDTHEIIRK